MIDFFQKYQGNIHSQNGEDLIVSQVLSRMDITIGHVVEAGGNDGLWMSNARHLIEQGWSCLFVEADYSLYLRCVENWKHNPKVRSQCSRVNPINVNAFVTNECDVLSIDLDGPDYEVFKGLKAKPKIVIIEIDSSILPGEFRLNADGASGYSMMLGLALQRGYFLICHTGNLVLIDNQYRHLFPDIIGDGVSNSELYFRRDWVC